MNDVAWARVMTVFVLSLVTAGCVSIGPLASGSVPLPSSATLLPTTAPTAGASAEPTKRPRASRNPSQAPTGQATATATTEPTATATSEPTATPSAEPTATATTGATPVPTLNYSLPAVFGSTALNSGFVPDPFTVGVTAGGDASVSYLGGGCSGNTTAAPTFSVNYTSGMATLLRFYFVGSGDTTMIVNSPAGTYSCVDDSFGTLHPTIDFNTPSSGRYDVWVATFTPGGTINGTLSVSEVSSNHP